MIIEREKQKWTTLLTHESKNAKEIIGKQNGAI